jgi:hypothetical protein
VDQAAGNVEAPAQQPENEQNRKNCPKHIVHPLPEELAFSWEATCLL